MDNCISGQDGHLSQYSLEWLDQNFHSPGTQVERFLWNGAGIREQQLPVTTFDSHMNTEDGLRNTLRNILKYGFCVVEGVCFYHNLTIIEYLLFKYLYTSFHFACTWESNKKIIWIYLH